MPWCGRRPRTGNRAVATLRPMSEDGGTAQRPRILIVGGGYVGLYVALGLQRRLRPDEADLTLVTLESIMTYQPFLPEAASGNIEPRHVVVPLRTVLKGVRLITGSVEGLDHPGRLATVAPSDG